MVIYFLYEFFVTNEMFVWTGNSMFLNHYRHEKIDAWQTIAEGGNCQTV